MYNSNNTNSQNWCNVHIISEQKTIFTEKELDIPGLIAFGKQYSKAAPAPLILHHHKDCIEFLIATSGQFKFYLDDEKYNITGNQIFIAKPGQSHGTLPDSFFRGEYYWIILKISDLKNFLFLQEDAARNFIERLSKIDTSVANIELEHFIPFLKACFIKMSKDNRLGYRFEIANHIVHLLECILYSCSISPSSISKEMEHVLNYIHKNTKLNISLEHLAEMCNLSHSHFKKRFREEVGTSPRDYVNTCKIDLAKRLLIDGSSITDIAMSLSYDSPNYFSTVFKKYTGSTPSEFLKQYQANTSSKQEKAISLSKLNHHEYQY